MTTTLEDINKKCYTDVLKNMNIIIANKTKELNILELENKNKGIYYASIVNELNILERARSEFETFA